MDNFKQLQVQKILAVVDTEVFGKFFHLVIPDGVHPGQVGCEHIGLSGLFHSFYQIEGFVHGLASSLDAMHSPDNQPEFHHLFRRSFSNAIKINSYEIEHHARLRMLAPECTVMIFITLPTARRIRVFHPIERALTGRT